MDLETEAKLRFLNHEEPRTWFLTNLAHGLLSYLTFGETDCGNQLQCYKCVSLLATYLVDFHCGFKLLRNYSLIQTHNQSQ